MDGRRGSTAAAVGDVMPEKWEGDALCRYVASSTAESAARHLDASVGDAAWEVRVL